MRASCRLRLQPDQRLALRHRVAVLDQPLQDDGGEVRGDRVLAAADLDVPQRRAGGDVGAGRGVLPTATGPERARLRRDQQPPVRDVPAVVVLRCAVLGQQRARRVKVIGGLQGDPFHVRQGPPGQAGQRAARR